MDEIINHGVIVDQRDTDWIAGVNTQIVYEVRNPSGDWRPFLPPGEKQVTDNYQTDFLDCVTRSLQNAIETQEKFLTGNQYDYSDRWTAKRSGTTKQGNYLYKVADQVRYDGLVLESEYPDIATGTWEEQYADIPEPLNTQLIANGQKWKEKWDFKYEFIPLNKQAMLDHIKQAPLQLVIPGHAVVGFLCEQDIVDYFDSYSPFEKKVQ